MSKERVIEVMDKYAAGVKGKIGLGFKNFKTGDEYYINGNDRFPTASVFKVLLLIELFKQVEQGKFSLSDMYTLKAEDISPGSGLTQYLTPGMSMCLKDYAMLMMIISDNTCTDIIYRHLGKKNVEATIESLGLKNTRADMDCKELLHSLCGMPLSASLEEMNKIFKDIESERNYAMYTDMTIPNDISSPVDMMAIFSKIYNKEILSPASCQQMMDIMEKCQTNSRIPSLLPRIGPKAIKAMHKTGSLQYISNDCGIVITPKHAYGIMMFYNGYTGDPKDRKFDDEDDTLLAELSRDIYVALHNDSASVV